MRALGGRGCGLLHGGYRNWSIRGVPLSTERRIETSGGSSAVGRNGNKTE
jgi:hypothetical protein